MCGISGILRAPNGRAKPDLGQTLRDMTRRLQTRGPDAEGLWVEGGIALGHRRLSILDLSETGAQPMLSPESRFAIAYNGEIYNHLELREALDSEAAAPEWAGHSDTETLLAGISHWGLEETLKRAKGMFALALWDRAEKQLALARDRMGEKPLYWGWSGSDLVFASELKALRAHPDCPREISRTALAQYLRFLYVPEPRTIHPSLFKLEPGTILSVEHGPPPSPPDAPLRPGDHYEGLSIRRYWSLNAEIENGSRAKITDDLSAINELEKTLGDVVKRQMLSDVPIGAFLSGGVDSSAIVALMQSQSAKAVKTFTIGFEQPDYDESPYAAAVAAHLGTDHARLIVTDQQVRDVIPNLPEIYDEPFADSSQIPTHLVCRAARDHVTVALSGDAGDELFGGYNRYLHGPALWNRLSKLPAPARRAAGQAACGLPEAAWDKLGAVYNKLKPGSGGVANLGTKAHRFGERLRDTHSLEDLYLNAASTWLDPESLLLFSAKAPASALSDPLPLHALSEPAAWMMAQDLRSYLPGDILCKVDRAAMNVSLETRAPFLDPDVIALSMRLPMGMKIRGGQGKWALRQVLYKYVPEDIIERPKAGFAVPIGQWLRGPLRDWAEDLLSEERIARDGFFDPKIVRQTWAEHLSGRRDRMPQLWAILMFQAWYTHWHE